MKTTDLPDTRRRRFVQGVGLSAAALALGLSPARLLARQGQTGAADLSGTHFALDIGTQPVNFTGRQRTAVTINNSLPAPTLRWREGDTVTLDVTNHLDVDSSIHWHGILLPYTMDGVPHLSFDGIQPGETFRYQFPLKQSGTYWYHSHSGFQEQQGMYGAIVVEPRDGDPHPVDRDYVMVLSDWSDNDPEDIYATLKKVSHYYNFNERTIFDTLRDFREKGVVQTLKDRHMWNTMRMSESDLADVTGYTYTYLLNGNTPAANWQGLFRPGERVRLRFINASAMTFFDVRIPGLKMTVVGTDGMPVEPVTVDEFRMGVAETFDVIVEPDEDRAYTVFAQSIDRSGFARGTLTSRPGLVAPVPEMDPAPTLGHREMGMGNHGGHDSHAGQGDHGQMDHSGHDMPAMDHGAMDHGSMDHNKAAGPGHDHATMDHSARDHASMDHGQMDHSQHAGMDSGTMAGHNEHAGHAMAGAGNGADNPDLVARTTVDAHLPSEYGPAVDMRAEMPVAMLDDPGIGLRNNGRRVLTYADLSWPGGLPDTLEVDREITLHLTGNMSRYMWSFNGIAFADAEPLILHYGERVRIWLVNDTMMHHPIHLHGLWSDLETGDGRLARKHTVVVKPGEKLSYLVRADTRGRWAYHCHLLYHMEAGMFREVRVV